MQTPGTLVHNGTLIVPNQFGITPGWNLIGYPANTSKPIAEALHTIEGSYTRVIRYDASDLTYYEYNATSSNGTLSSMIPYYGYWILVTQSDTLFVT